MVGDVWWVMAGSTTDIRSLELRQVPGSAQVFTPSTHHVRTCHLHSHPLPLPLHIAPMPHSSPLATYPNAETHTLPSSSSRHFACVTGRSQASAAHRRHSERGRAGLHHRRASQPEAPESNRSHGLHTFPGLLYVIRLVCLLGCSAARLLGCLTA